MSARRRQGRAAGTTGLPSFISTTPMAIAGRVGEQSRAPPRREPRTAAEPIRPAGGGDRPQRGGDVRHAQVEHLVGRILADGSVHRAGAVAADQVGRSDLPAEHAAVERAERGRVRTGDVEEHDRRRRDGRRRGRQRPWPAPKAAQDRP